jgi:hypothetical protein
MNARILWPAAALALGAIALGQCHTQSVEQAALRAELAELRQAQAQATRLAPTMRDVRMAARAAAAQPEDLQGPPARGSAASPAGAAEEVAPPVEAGSAAPEPPGGAPPAAEESFRAEPVDGTWSVSAATHLRDQLTAAATAGIRLGELECRSASCRLEVRYRDAEASRQFVRQALRSPEARAWDGSFVIEAEEPGPDGSFAAVVYLRRDGRAEVSRAE